MGRSFMSAAVYVLLVAFILLSMNHWSLLTEARILHSSAFQGAHFLLSQFFLFIDEKPLLINFSQFRCVCCFFFTNLKLNNT